MWYNDVMSIRSKTWLKVAALISILTCVAYIVVSILVGFNLFDLSKYYLEWYRVIARGATDLDGIYLRITIISSFVLSGIINLVCAITYCKVVAKKYPNISDYYSLCVMSVIQFVFGGTLIPAVIALVVAIRNRHLYTTQKEVQQQNEYDTLKGQIAKLNKLKEDGMISPDNYSKELNNLLSQYVNNKKDN